MEDNQNQDGVDYVMVAFDAYANGSQFKVITFICRFVLGLSILLLRKNVINNKEIRNIISIVR
jgi:hypothetical protein